MSTLVIQLGRLGDVIQTTPLLQQIAAVAAGERLDLLVVEPNQHAVSGLAGITAVHTISEKRKDLDDQIAAGFPHRQIPSAAWDLLRELSLPAYDRVINASHAALGCWLASEIPCRTRGGGVIDRQGECLYLGEAHAYRVAMLNFRRQNWFNVVDLLRCAGPPAARAAGPKLHVNVSRELPFALPPGRRVALNVGANEKHRCWPARHFAALAETLHHRGFIPILVGASSDREVCAEVEAASQVRLPNFAGQTSIPEMARLLKECDLLVSSDTGAVHIAAAVGTKVLGLYGATAYFAETSPWGENHLVLQTELGAALPELAREIVTTAALNRLHVLQEVELRHDLQRFRQSAWETRFLLREEDELGGLSYRPLHSNFQSAADSFAQALRRAFAEAWSCGHDTEAAGDRPDTRLARERGVASLAQMSVRSRNIASALLQVLEQMQSAAVQCQEWDAQDDSELRRSRISRIAPVLSRTVETLVSVVSIEECEMFRPVVHYLDWRLRLMQQLASADTFRECAQECRAAANILRKAYAAMGSDGYGFGAAGN